MPTSSKDINVNTSPSEETAECEKSSNGEIDISVKVAGAPESVSLNEDQKLSFALRDFIGSTRSAAIDNEDNEGAAPRRLSESLPYIDEQDASADEAPGRRDTDDVLNNAACRLRRWRAASRKLRRPRIINNLCGGDDKRKGSADTGHTDLADRLRNLATAGGVTSSASELLTLAPPPPAATAPPSPSCLLTPTLADQSHAEYFVSISELIDY